MPQPRQIYASTQHRRAGRRWRRRRAPRVWAVAALAAAVVAAAGEAIRSVA
jgi:Flp pilus assembly protein TadB